jgi:hypothetical protein
MAAASTATGQITENFRMNSTPRVAVRERTAKRITSITISLRGVSMDKLARIL